jgi:glutathione S-transferase
MWESCAIMMYLANKHRLEVLYPSDPGRRALVDSANMYLTGTFYPLVSRATYPRLGFPCYPGEVAATDGAPDELKDVARRASEEALAEPLEVFHTYFVRDGFIGDGEGPSIADIRLACSLEFLAMNDTPLPRWAQDYLARVEKALAGFTVESMDMGPMGTYHVLNFEGKGRAGLMKSQMPEIPSNWLPYVQVDNPDQTAERAKKLGGTITVPPTDIPEVGRFAVITDNQGGTIGILKPSPRS